MIPMPTKFAELRSRSTGPWSGAWIVKITTNDFIGATINTYVSDTDMQLGSDHVYGWLRSVSEFGRGADIYRLTYNPARAVITLRDQHYHRTAATVPARPSDKLPVVPTVGDVYKGLHHGLVELLIYPGSYANAISDCLSVYQGVVTRYVAQDEHLTIFTDERRKVVHRELPQRKFTRALFPKMPAENENETMPLVYGPHNELSYQRNTGFAPAERIDNWKFIVSDHALDSFVTEPRVGAGADTQAIWIWIDELQCYARSYVGVTFSVNDSGRGTFTIDPDAVGLDVYIPPTAAYPTSSGSDASNLRGSEAIRDNLESTKLSVIANSTTQAEVILEWSQQGDESDDDQNNSIAELPGPATPLYGLDLAASKPGGITISSASMDWWNGSGWVNFASAISTSTSAMNHYPINPATNLFYGTAESMRWHFGTGPAFTSPGAPDRKPFKIRIRFNGSGWTANTTVVAYLHEARLVMSCKMPRNSSKVVNFKYVGRRVRQINVLGQTTGWTTVYDRVPVTDIDARIIGASVQGREFGSWIDNGGRTNSHNAGDQISTAPGIVESLLRDELDVPTASIDQPSFDAAMTDATYNRAAKLHLKSGARQNSKTVIERLCWEHAMFLVQRPNGQLRLIRVPGSGELVAELKPDDIYEQTPIIETTDVAVIRNELTFYYNRMADSGKYLRSQLAQPVLGASVARYGVIPDEFQMQSHSDVTSSTKAFYDYLLDDYAILARPHLIVKFTARGFRFAHAELGDHFNFAVLETREIRQLFGKSWGSVDLMIYDMLYKSNGIQFTCIKWTPE